MKIEKLDEFHSYFSELVRLLLETENYIALDRLNYNAYSVKYNWLYQSICSEVDVVMKEVALYIDPNAKTSSVLQCQKLL